MKIILLIREIKLQIDENLKIATLTYFSQC